MCPPKAVVESLKSKGYSLLQGEKWRSTKKAGDEFEWLCAYMQKEGSKEVFLVTVGFVTGECLVEVLRSTENFRVPVKGQP